MNPNNKKKEEETRWFLESVSDASEKWMVVVEPFPFVIGREQECNLTLSSKWISRRHAEIRRGGDLLWIRDLGSTNGTHVNYKQVAGAELLEAGDIIGFGKSEFRLKSVDSVRSALLEDTFVMRPSEQLAHLAHLEPHLRKLLAERAVIPHFQPILRLADMQVVGYEILGRVGGDELPSDANELFELAGYLGFASDLSALFREIGIDEGRRLTGSPLLFANTNPVEMGDMSLLVESLERVRNMAPSNRIVLEINEKAVAETAEMELLRNKLDDLNMGVAFDDFGVGQTRLLELAKAPPDFLKFDISLIRDIHVAPKRLHQMVLTFVNAAKDLGVGTLAEGVECLAESETCKLLGFEYAQGFFYGKPLPIGEIALS
jgi:EAL domain-containing protein (putative c-di-GMP-specific phosphodiesterase class I)